MILFLDFDGVLHPDAVFLENRQPVLRAEGALFMWADLLIDALAPHPRVKIVLSTSWARNLGYQQARDALPEALRGRVIGATMHCIMDGGWGSGLSEGTRYQQIARYVRRAAVDRWLAIDDDGEGWAGFDRRKLVLTRPEVGISDPEALALLREGLA